LTAADVSASAVVDVAGGGGGGEHGRVGRGPPGGRRQPLDLRHLLAEPQRDPDPPHVVLERLGDLVVEEPEHLPPAPRRASPSRPGRASMQAYSTPITPPPTTIIVRGSRSSRSSSSLVNTVLLSNGTDFGRAGRVPVAITIFSALTASKSSARSTYSTFSSSNRAAPPQQLDPVPVEVVADQGQLVVDHLLADVDQVRDRDVPLDPAHLAEQLPAADAGQVQDGLPEAPWTGRCRC
jgi:hypothetical protein